jgi:hypothetical protein
MIKKRIILIFTFLVVFFGFQKTLFSQFTYLETGLGFNTLPIYSSFGSTYTSYTNMSVRLSGVIRVKRYLGIGIEASIPVVQSSKFSFKQGTFFNFEDAYTPEYRPSKYDYSFKESPRISIFARFFFDTRVNSYVDVKVSVFKFTESFVFYRDSVPPMGAKYAIKKADYDDEIKYMEVSPGFSVGIAPRIGKHFFLNFNMGANIYIFNKTSFNHRVPFQWDSYLHDHSQVNLKSQLSQVKGVFNMNLGFGYFF